MMSDADLPPVKYEFGNFVKAVFFQYQEKTSGEKLGETTQETTQEKVLKLIKQRPEITGNEMAAILGLTSDGIKYHLDQLRRLRRIRHVGPTKKGRWEVLQPKK